MYYVSYEVLVFEYIVDTCIHTVHTTVVQHTTVNLRLVHTIHTSQTNQTTQTTQTTSQTKQATQTKQSCCRGCCRLLLSSSCAPQRGRNGF